MPFFLQVNFFFVNVCSSKLKIRFVITNKILIKLEKKSNVLFFQDFKGKSNFSESALFHREMGGLNFLDLT